MEEKITSEEKLFSAIGYLGILCLIPLLLKKESKFCQFHGKQGLILLIVWVILAFVNIIPILGQIISVIGSLIVFVLNLIVLIEAALGKYWEIPVLGEYAKKLKI